MMNIHPTAIIEDGAKLGDNVQIGPYSIVGKEVELGNDVHLDSHVVVTGRTKIGARTRIFPFASIGQIAQNLKFNSEKARLEIGEDNKIREYVTINAGTAGGHNLTKIGNHCLFMASSHVAHDCLIGDNVIFANNVIVGGHVTIGDYAIFGGLSGAHQFSRIGEHAFLGGGSIVVGDVIPYGSVMGNRACLSGLNLVGLKRRGIDKVHINDLRAAYKTIFEIDDMSLVERIMKARSENGGSPLVDNLINFMLVEKNRGYCMPPTLEK